MANVQATAGFSISFKVPHHVTRSEAVYLLGFLKTTEDFNHSDGDENRCVFLGKRQSITRAIGEAYHSYIVDNHPLGEVDGEVVMAHAYQMMVSLSEHFTEDACELNYAWDGIGLWQA